MYRKSIRLFDFQQSGDGMRLSGRAYKLQGRVSATDLLPAQYDRLSMRREWSECAKHILEGMIDGSGRPPSAGDILVGGNGVGSGHAHYHMGALMACKEAGVLGLIGVGVDGMFQRAAIDMGYLAWSLSALTDFVDQRDELDIDLREGRAENRSKGTTLTFEPLPSIILDILKSNGAFNWALARSGQIPASVL